jgi:FAD/FMN-containing dehydrogenase
VAVRASSTLRDLSAAVSSSEAAVLARAGNGVFYFCFPEPAQAAGWIAAARARGWKVSVEAAPEQHKPGLAMWEPRAGEFEIMERIKGMFDPQRLLNPGRLYGRI